MLHYTENNYQMKVVALLGPFTLRVCLMSTASCLSTELPNRSLNENAAPTKADLLVIRTAQTERCGWRRYFGH
jgi:hypothetical protein